MSEPFKLNYDHVKDADNLPVHYDAECHDCRLAECLGGSNQMSEGFAAKHNTHDIEVIETTKEADDAV
jgi:hypothetical protein